MPLNLLTFLLTMRTNVYVDGFNLYYRALKDSIYYKWLDIYKLSQALIPSHEINRIRYFTAIIKHDASDPTRQTRQLAFLRALNTIDCLTIHYGQFKDRQKRRPPVHPIPGITGSILFKDREEKGSDVNLATHLLVDGYEKDYEQALVISNDSDLAEPIRMVRERLGLNIGVVNPSPPPKKGKKDQNPTAAELQKVASFRRRIWVKTLRECQFPDTLRDKDGELKKPSEWH